MSRKVKEITDDGSRRDRFRGDIDAFDNGRIRWEHCRLNVPACENSC